MDTLTLAIIAAAEVGATYGEPAVGKRETVDAYGFLKEVIRRKFAEDVVLLEAIDAFEADPTSAVRRQALRDAIVATGAHQDAMVLQAAQALLDKIEDQPGGEQFIP